MMDTKLTGLNNLSSLSDSFGQARNALELNGLNAIRQQSKSADGENKKAALKEAAQQFEAIFMKMLLKSMRQAQEVLESDSPFNSQSTKFYRDMHDQQMAVELSSNGSLGLSDLIVRQLGGDDNFTPKSLIRNDGNLPSTKQIINNEGHNNIHNKAGMKLSIESLLATPNVTPNARSNVSPNAQLNVTPENVKISTPLFSAPKDFVTALAEPAKNVQKKLGIPFEVVIAQAALETGWGQKIVTDNQGSSSNNLFNIKADARWSGDKTQKETLEFEEGAMVKKNAAFRTYESLTDSVNDYVDFLSTNERYQDALKKSTNVEHFLHGLQKAGYATDPNYANKILGTLGKVTRLLAE